MKAALQVCISVPQGYLKALRIVKFNFIGSPEILKGFKFEAVLHRGEE